MCMSVYFGLPHYCSWTDLFVPASLPNCFNYQNFKYILIQYSWIIHLLTWKFRVGKDLRSHWLRSQNFISILSFDQKITESLRNKQLPPRSHPQVPSRARNEPGVWAGGVYFEPEYGALSHSSATLGLWALKAPLFSPLSSPYITGCPGECRSLLHHLTQC